MQSHEKEINTSYGRFVLDGSADAKMASRLASTPYPQQDVIDLVRACDARTVVDVGAHVGTVSVPLAQASVAVTAFEPNAKTFEYLQRNSAQNGVRIDTRNKGLAQTPGRASSTVVQQTNAGAHTLGVGDDIEVSTLDAEVDTADFIKIDVEGMELEVLEGGVQLLARAHPAVYFEVNLTALRAHGTPLGRLTDFFTRAGYALYVVGDRRLYRVPGVAFAALFFAPRSIVTGSDAAPFDLLAVHREARVPYPTRGVLISSIFLLLRYVTLQYGRFTR